MISLAGASPNTGEARRPPRWGSTHTYRTDGTSDCYWERLSDLTGELTAILANDGAVGQAYVELLPTDVGVATQGSGTRSRVG